MKLLTFAAACAAVATLSAAPTFAFAGDAVVAKLAQPVSSPTKFIAGGAMFVCDGDACTAAAPASQTLSAAACKTIANKVGLVTSFGSFKSLDETQLGACNAVAIAKASSPQMAKQ